MLCQEKFDIFQGHVDRDPIWVEVVDGLACAFERIEEFAAEKPAHYFVKSLNTHKVLASVDSTKGKQARVACLVHTTGRSPRGGE
jgi:hypothetical protein